MTAKRRNRSIETGTVHALSVVMKFLLSIFVVLSVSSVSHADSDFPAIEYDFVPQSLEIEVRFLRSIVDSELHRAARDDDGTDRYLSGVVNQLAAMSQYLRSVPSRTLIAEVTRKQSVTSTQFAQLLIDDLWAGQQFEQSGTRTSVSEWRYIAIRRYSVYKFSNLTLKRGMVR